MIDKISAFFYMMYLKADLAVKKMKSEEDGMETVQAIILVAIAVVLGVFIVDILTKGKFGDSKNGLVGYVFNEIQKKIDDIFKVKANDLSGG